MTWKHKSICKHRIYLWNFTSDLETSLLNRKHHDYFGNVAFHLEVSKLKLMFPSSKWCFQLNNRDSNTILFRVELCFQLSHYPFKGSPDPSHFIFKINVGRFGSDKERLWIKWRNLQSILSRSRMKFLSRSMSDPPFDIGQAYFTETNSWILGQFNFSTFESQVWVASVWIHQHCLKRKIIHLSICAFTPSSVFKSPPYS